MEIISRDQYIELLEGRKIMNQFTFETGRGFSRKQLLEIAYLLLLSTHSDGTVTESLIEESYVDPIEEDDQIFDEFIDYLAEKEMGFLKKMLRAKQIKSVQNKANKLKIDKANVEVKTDKIKDNLKSKNALTPDMTKKLNMSLDRKKELMTKQESELEKQASLKSGGDTFLNNYRQTLKSKGEAKAAKVELKNATDKEKKDIEERIKRSEQRAKEAAMKAKEAADNAKSKESENTSQDNKQEIKDAISANKEEISKFKEEIENHQDAIKKSHITKERGDELIKKIQAKIESTQKNTVELSKKLK